MIMSTRHLFGAALVLLLLAGCGGVPDPLGDGPVDPPSTGPDEATQTTGPTDGGDDGGDGGDGGNDGGGDAEPVENNQVELTWLENSNNPSKAFPLDQLVEGRDQVFGIANPPDAPVITVLAISSSSPDVEVRSECAELQPGDVCNFGVTLRASEVGSYSATLTATFDDDSVTEYQISYEATEPATDDDTGGVDSDEGVGDESQDPADDGDSPDGDGG